MFNVMRQPLGRYLPGDSRYEWSFDFLEYLIGFAHIELELKLRHDRAGWCPPGRFCWKARNDDYNVVQRAELQLKTEREKWNVLKAGFANGNPALALEIQSKMRSFISSLPWH